MTRLNDTLPDLMRRATDELEPVSTDLLERTLRQGHTLRRRRTTLRIGAATTAVAATVGLIAGGSQILAAKQDAPAAAGDQSVTVTTKPTAAPAKPSAVTPEQTLATLRTLVEAPGRQLSQPRSWSGAPGHHSATIIVDDGNGRSRVDAGVNTENPPQPCSSAGRATCTRRPDGSYLWASKEVPQYPGNRNVDGVLSNHATIQYPDGRAISVVSYNAPDDKGTKHTRAKPLLSVEQLTAIAANQAWKFPPAQPAPPPKRIGDKAKPTTR